MSKDLLFYQHAVPVNAQRHQNWSLATRGNYDFTGQTNWVPLATSEFSAVAKDYAIVFVGADEAIHPAVILGLRSDENLYLNEQGKWDAGYIPAFVRRYPFVFSKNSDGDKLTLCIDEQHGGWNQEGTGKPLFDAEGKGTEFLNEMFKFVIDYQRQFDMTLAFCKKLEQLELLEPMKAQFKLLTGEQAQFTGFRAIDREKLKALPGDTLVELSKSGELELIYTHLQSLRNFSDMTTRLKTHEEESNSGDSDQQAVDDYVH